MRPISLHRLARREIHEAVRFYKERGRGHEFFEQIQWSIDYLRQMNMRTSPPRAVKAALERRCDQRAPLLELPARPQGRSKLHWTAERFQGFGQLALERAKRG